MPSCSGLVADIDVSVCEVARQSALEGRSAVDAFEQRARLSGMTYGPARSHWRSGATHRCTHSFTLRACAGMSRAAFLGRARPRSPTRSRASYDATSKPPGDDRVGV